MITNAIDHALLTYTQQRINEETSKNIEDMIFFSSYSIDISVFRKATQKLKKKLRQKNNPDLLLWEDEAKKVIATYGLTVSSRDIYLLKGLLKAQIQINEAMLLYFSSLYKQAHDFDYFERRAQQIQSLLSE